MPALRALSGVQVGLEAAGTPGTPVAATINLPFEPDGAGYTPMRMRKTLQEPRGVLGRHDDVLVRQASALRLQQNLDFTHALLPLLCGIQGATPTTVATDYLWSMALRNTNPQAVRSATFEVFQRDGSVNDYQAEFAFGVCTEFTINIPAGEDVAMITSTWIGRAETVAAPTASLGIIADREVIPTDLFSVFLDTTWAGLGTTAIGGDVRSASLQVNTGITPRYNKAGRTAQDMTGIYRGEPTGKLEVELDVDSVSADIIAAWRSGDLRFARLEALGSSDRYFRADSSLRFLDDPEILGADGDHSTVTLAGDLRFDDVSDEMLSFSVRNELAAWP